MVTKNLDTMTKNLRMPVMAESALREFSSGRSGLRVLPAVRSHARRCQAPGAPESESLPDPRVLAATLVAGRSAKRAGRLAASRSGSFSVTRRIGLAPVACLPGQDSRDYQSTGYLEAQRNRTHGPTPPYSRGK